MVNPVCNIRKALSVKDTPVKVPLSMNFKKIEARNVFLIKSVTFFTLIFSLIFIFCVLGSLGFRRLSFNSGHNKKGDKRQQPTQCRCLNVYFLAINFTL